MKISKELVEYVANLSRIKLDEKSTEKMQKEIGAVIEYMEILNSLDTTDIEAKSHNFDVTNVMREDIVKESYDREELLKNAPKRNEETFVVPKTVD